MQQLAASSIHWSTLVNNAYVLAVFGAVCGFVFALILARIQARGAPHKAISWDVTIERPPELEKGGRSKLGILYNDVRVVDLVQAYVLLENTGNTVIKNEYVRFKLPDESKIIEVATDPVPEPELGVSEIQEPGLTALERRYKISHLEVGQSVRFHFVTDGGAWSGWDGMHPFNEEGDVVFQCRDIARAREDVEEVKPFVRSAATLLLVALLTVVVPYPESLIFAALAVPLCGYIIFIAPRILRVVQRVISAQFSQPNLSFSDRSAALVGNNTTQYNIYRQADEL